MKIYKSTAVEDNHFLTYDSESEEIIDSFKIEKIHIANIIIKKSAIYVFIGYNGNLNEKQMGNQIVMVRQNLQLNVSGVFYIFLSDDADYIYDDKENCMVEISEEQFQNLYVNMQYASNPLFLSLQELIEKQELDEEEENENIYYYAIETARYKIEQIRNNNCIGKYKYDDEGNKYVKRGVNSTRLFGIKIPTLYVTNDNWYRVNDDDDESKRQLLVTAFGGWFGLHKFMNREFGSGILYLLTCGGFGIFYLFDLISLITGYAYYYNVTYEYDEAGKLHQYKEKVYFSPYSNKVLMWILVGVAIILTLVVANTLYSGLFKLLISVLSQSGGNLNNYDYDALLEYM